MKSFRNIANLPRALPLLADDVTELHASRLLLLLKVCGTAGRIEGLTKLAKMDFFVRYPAFFERISEMMGQPVQSGTKHVESAMVRHHYGPWDKRYYQILPFLESRNLISVTKDGSAFVFRLTEEGKRIAGEFEKQAEFKMQIEQMKRVKKLLGTKSGSTLKNLIYEQFDKEVGEKALGEIIQ